MSANKNQNKNNAQNTKKKICALILCAGYSSRMSIGIKALLPLGKYPHMLISSIETCLKAGIEDIYIVLGHEKEKIAEAVKAYYGKKHNISFVENKDFDNGMFSSIQVGFQGIIEANKNYDAAFLLPVDAALVRYSTLAAMQEAYQECDNSKILIPHFQGKSGHPPLIGAEHFEAITKYSGEQGLRTYLAPFAENSRFDIVDEGILSDIDSEIEYNKAIEFLNFTLNRELLSFAECLELMQKENLPEKVITHSIKVGLASFRLALALNIEGLEPQYAFIAGLLHDIKKLEDKHPKAGETLLSGMHYKGIACPIATHMDMPTSVLEKMKIDFQDLQNSAILLNEECLEDISCYYSCICVYIADRFYIGSDLVSIDERFKKVEEKYKDDLLALEAIEQRKKIANKIVEFYNKYASKQAELIVNSPSKHAYEDEFEKVFKKYI